MTDLSTIINITNNTLFEFKKISEEIIFGEWDNPLPGLIVPVSTYKHCVLEDDAGSASGSEGKISYAFGDTILDMTFCDSWSANNNYATINTRGDTVLSNRYNIKTSFRAKTNGGTWVYGSCPQSGHPVFIQYKIDAEYPRHATDEEFALARKTMPKIQQDEFRLIGDLSNFYNCIAWSMGITYAWINPKETPEEMITLYAQAGKIVHTNINPKTGKEVQWRSNFNYVLTKKLDYTANIDLMCTTKEYKLSPTHATRRYQDAYFKSHVWTAKAGNFNLLKQKRGDGIGPKYGDITHSFVKRRIAVPPLTQGENNSVIYKDFNEVYRARHLAIMDAPVDIGRMEKLDEIIQGCDTALKTCFEERYACWNRERANMCSSNTYDYVFLNSFNNLAAMGIGILPLVVKKMSLEQNFHDLPLYESLQPEKLLCVSQPSTDAEDSLPLEAEQSRARRTVHLYLQDLP